mgnify:CR=1 FL=1
MKKPSQLRAKKHLSQNFLTDQNVINKIIKSFDLGKSDHVIEIGPGYGSMTFPIIEMVDSIDVIELDKDLANYLNEHDRKGLINVIQADAMRFDFASLKKKKKIRLIGNLPYHISTPLLFHLLNFSEIFNDFHVMVQKEVAERMCATPQQRKDYGSLSLAVGLGFDCQTFLNVPPTAFRPIPKVDSSLIFLQPRSSGLEAEDENKFLEWSRTLFGNRRKLLYGSIKRHFPDWYHKDHNYLQESIGKRRPEEIPQKEWLNLFSRFLSFTKQK